MKWIPGKMSKGKRHFQIEWDINEQERLKDLIKDIKRRSVHLSRFIRDKIKENISLIEQNPYLFEKDTFKTNNDGSYRKFTAIHIRIVYKIDTDKIIIVRVRYATSEPTSY
jgi:mRNA-degrading endonuclease RelE of RelBE toxin-antitoxin system